MSRKFTIFVALDVNRYDGAANVDSPLLRSRGDVDVVAGFAWSIGQSTRLVNDAR